MPVWEKLVHRAARLLAACLSTVLVTTGGAVGLGAVPVSAGAAAGRDAPAGPGFSLAGLTATVVGDVCNLRSGPGTTHGVVGRVVRGQLLAVTGSRDGWIRVRDGDREGWIAGWLVDVDLTPRRAEVFVERTAVNLRAGPGLDHPVVGRTDRGERHRALALRGEWVKVSHGEGSAWIWLPLVSLRPPSGEGGQGGSLGEGPGAGESPADTQVAVPEGFPPGLLVYPAGATAVVRRTAVVGSQAVGEVTPGQPARYLDTREGWILVRTPSGGQGWVWGPDARLEWPGQRIFCRVGPSAWSMGCYPTATVTARNVNFRAGPGLQYRVVGRLNRGDVLRVLDRSGEWIRAISPRGTVGWVAGWLTGGVKPPRDGFLIQVEGGEASRTLSISGNFSSVRVVADDAGRSVVLTLSRPLAGRAALGIGTFEFSHLVVAGREVRVFLREQPSYRVAESGPGRVVLEFRAQVSSLSVRAEGDREVLTVTTGGYTSPRVSREGDRVKVTLPGARWVAGQGAPPADGSGWPGAGEFIPSRLVRGVDVHADQAGVSLLVETAPGTSYRVEKEANVVRVRFSPPGLRGKTVVIDPGHGGADTGARGHSGLLEKHVNWEIARRLAELLEARGARVILTRKGDAGAEMPPGWTPAADDYEGELAWRAAWSQAADVFVSLHHDYHPSPSAQGTTTYVAAGELNESESRRLAGLVQEEVVRRLGTYSRGVREAEYYVIRKARCPAVLVELMYLSHPAEEARLRQESTLWQAAAALLAALERFFG